MVWVAVGSISLVALVGARLAWSLARRRRSSPEEAPRPRSYVRVLDGPDEIRDALGRAMAFEQSVAGVVAERIARYERLAGAEEMPRLPFGRPRADSA